MQFTEFGLEPPLLRAIEAIGHTQPTPIQAAALPIALAGHDVLGLAQTGTGKTASFALPVLQRLMHSAPEQAPRALILAPTRELASQIDDHIRALGQFLKMRSRVITGGVGVHGQASVLRRGTDILVACPGRLLDHLQRGTVSLTAIEVLVLDEADRMLDMGFIRDIKKIVAYLPTNRQTLLFSATMSPTVDALTRSIQRNPQRVVVSPPSSAPRKIEQFLYPTDGKDKRQMLLQLLQLHDITQTIVFTRTKWDANKVATFLEQNGHQAAAIHGNKSQSQRRQTLERFRGGRLRVMVATDIASRGIDVEAISHVINFSIPHVPEDYVHRIGRAGRAERHGVALSLMSDAEAPLLRDIEKLLGQDMARYNIDGSPQPRRSAPARTSAPRAAAPAARRGRPTYRR